MFIDDVAFELLKRAPFYANLLRTCKIKIDNNLQYPAAVLVKHGLEMVINEEMMKKMPIEIQAGVLEHEFQHIVRRHIQQYQSHAHEPLAHKVGKPADQMVLNLAFDSEINPHIKSLRDDPERGQAAAIKAKELIDQIKATNDEKLKAALNQQLHDLTKSGGFVFPEFFDEKSGDNWQHYYLALLAKAEVVQQKVKVLKEASSGHDWDQQKQKGQGEKGDEDGNGNEDGNNPQIGDHNHDYFKESSDNEEIVDSMISEALREAASKNAGKMPGEVREYFNEVERKKALPWVTILRQFVQTLVSTNRRHNWKKVNRRFPHDLPGYKREPKLKILVGLDASGSVPDTDWAEFMNEIYAVHASGVEVWVAEFDTRVTNYYKFEGIHKPRSTSGGTSFVPVHEKAIEGRFQGLIMFTDGYGDFPDAKKVNYQSLWVMSSNAKAPYGVSLQLPSSIGRGYPW